MKLRLLSSESIDLFAYAVYKNDRLLYCNSLFRACFLEGMRADTLQADRVVYRFEEPEPYFAVRDRFSMGESIYTLLICLSEAHAPRKAAPSSMLMRPAADFFATLLAFTRRENTTQTACDAQTLCEDALATLKKSFPALRSSVMMRQRSYTRIDRDGFMLAAGLLLPDLIEKREIHVSSETFDAGNTTLIFAGSGEVQNPFHRALAGAIGSACSFSVTFSKNCVRLTPLRPAPQPGMVLAAGSPFAAMCMALGITLYRAAQPAKKGRAARKKPS